MSINCQIPTPPEYVKQLLDSVKYKENLYGKRILENSCGEGNILCNIVERYLEDTFSHGYDVNTVRAGLERDIVAYEIDSEKIDVCKKRLNSICLDYGITNVNWTINHVDYLASPKDTFDFVVGNPPYITYHDMTKSQRENLRNIFKSCQKGRFDYCYAFIEKSLDSLSDNGVLTYLVPYGVLRNQFAENIRLQILPNLTDVYDYEGISVFEGVISSSVVIVCNKSIKTTNIHYHKVLDDIERVVSKKSLGDKWFFETKSDGKKRFGDYYDVKNSIATLCNEAFLIDDYTYDDEYVYVRGEKIEKAVVRKAVSAKNKRSSKKDMMIIFPYEIIDNKLSRFPSERYFQVTYPFAYSYLKKYKHSLTNRKSNENVKWFEYGRTQALSQIFGSKLVMSMVVTKKIYIYVCETMDIPYAGYFIKAKDNIHTLDQAKNILESKKFFDYVKSHGTPTTDVSYRISVKEILNYMY